MVFNNEDNSSKNINRIRETLKKLVKMAEQKEQKLSDVPLKDGRKLVIDDAASIEVGTEIYMVDDQGNLIPCEDNTYELEDGRTITVKDGKIEAIADNNSPADQANDSPVEDANTEMAETEPAADQAKEDEGASKMEARISALEEQIAEILKMLQGLSKTQETTMSRVKELEESPADSSIELKRTPVSTGKKDVDVTMDSLRETIKNLRKNR